MNVICLEEEAFFELINQVKSHLNNRVEEPFKWINQEEAMRLLNVKSPTTMQEYRDNGEIRFSQPRKRIILYDRDSINAFLERHAKDTF